VLVCAAHHPFARRRTIAIKELEGQTFVGYERDIPTRKATDRLLNRRGVSVRYVMELDNIETIKRVVEIGAGVALVPEPTIKQEVKSRTLAAVQLSDEALYRPLGILHRQGRHFTPAIERFIAELK
jgi:DNA-binding transcriptional LysR family regulator